MLTHWTRRHRPLALTVIALLGLAIASAAFYIWAIAAERDRADISEQQAMRAQASAETALDELTLKHAQLLLTTDPSAAVDALATYRGPDASRANQIRAEATGRGVAVLRAVPHTNNVRWAEGTGDDAVFSLSSDGTIARTRSDGTPAVVTRNVAQVARSSYSRPRRLLAYVCNPTDVCIYDIRSDAPIPVPTSLQGARAVGISFSSDGSLLALLSQASVLRILDVTDPAKPLLRFSRTIEGGNDVKFFTASMVAVTTGQGITFVDLDGDMTSFPWSESSFWDAHPGEPLFTAATIRGQALVIEGFPLRIAARTALCRGPIQGLRFIPGRRAIAYACREGTVGIWDFERADTRPRLHFEGHTDLMTVSPTGEYIIAGGGQGTVAVLDLSTDLTTTYKGHGFRLTSLSPPTSEYPFVISTDVSGALRTWPLPQRFAKVVVRSDSAFHTAIFEHRRSLRRRFSRCSQPSLRLTKREILAHMISTMCSLYPVTAHCSPRMVSAIWSNSGHTPACLSSASSRPGKALYHNSSSLQTPGMSSPPVVTAD
jgi:WD40 repeat protein